MKRVSARGSWRSCDADGVDGGGGGSPVAALEAAAHLTAGGENPSSTGRRGRERDGERRGTPEELEAQPVLA